jgi:hypothetical protein
MKLKEAKELKYRQCVYHMWARQKNGLPICGRVCSIKLWKSDPNRFQIGLRIGFSDHVYLVMSNAHEWCLTPEETYKEKRFCVEHAHLEIVPEFGFSGLKEKNKETKEQTLWHNYVIRLYLIAQGSNHRACVAFDAIKVPASEFPDVHIFVGCIPTIRRAITCMKHRAHRIFNTKEVWCDLRDKEDTVIGLRTI